MAGLRDREWRPSYGPDDDPLHSFYIPALAASVRYDRLAGFFSSHALAVAAQGVARLIAHGGHMRLLVCARLSPEDVEAVQRGVALRERLEPALLELLNDPAALKERLVRERLKVLAWLVANGRLEIRVVVPCDPATRRPLAADALFHAKGGIMQDAHGDGIAFSGSINETAVGWQRNYERFHVFPSWQEPHHYAAEAEAFQRLWTNAEQSWLAVELPEAVRRRLIDLAPPDPPAEEPLDRLYDPQALWLAAFLRDAPRLATNGWKVGIETARLRPFPHQRYVAYELVQGFMEGKPIRRLLADEVGLGKTIEAALVLRSLLLAGRLKRVLILVPRGLVTQWQEALWSDFLVEAVFFDGRDYHFPDGRREPAPGGPQAWRTHPVTISSYQLARRAERERDLLESGEIDLLIVDEAHHARRRDFLDLSRFRPNRFLALLRSLKDQARNLLLLTATPMQLHPVEVYDLLSLLGLSGRWAEQAAFLRFFEELRKPASDLDFDFISAMLHAAISAWGWQREYEEQARSRLGLAWTQLEFRIKRGMGLGALDSHAKNEVIACARAHTPVNQLMYRHTRGLLKGYRAQGKISDNIPERRPRPLWLDMSPKEEKLYNAVENYISDFYARYKDERRGLGWVLTVYRRRMTSSLYALQRSLERRLRALQEGGDVLAGLEDDLPEDDEELEEEVRRGIAIEKQVVARLLALMQDMPRESKLTSFIRELEVILRHHHQVLVFTQYTDTMDFLREALKLTFGGELACYSGRGGERWDSKTNEWTEVAKEHVQEEFLKGGIKVLLCTEAGAEGLNLQSCGVVVNFDLPWNPMRLEQRIGRIDRIGQTYPIVEVLHFLYQGTVEARVYGVLGHRLDWFESVVGPLQPVLHQAERTIEELAMLPRKEREAAISEKLRQLERELEAYDRPEIISASMPWLADVTRFTTYEAPDAPVTLDRIASILKRYEPWKTEVRWLSPDVFVLASQPQRKCTFKQMVQQAEDVEFTSYGHPALDELLALPLPSEGRVVQRTETDDGIMYESVENGYHRPIRNLVDIEAALDS